jgi:hypothetical protein
MHPLRLLPADPEWGSAGLLQTGCKSRQILPQSGKGLQIWLRNALKNNHKGYIGSFTNTVSYSV